MGICLRSQRVDANADNIPFKCIPYQVYYTYIFSIICICIYRYIHIHTHCNLYTYNICIYTGHLKVSPSSASLTSFDVCFVECVGSSIFYVLCDIYIIHRHTHTHMSAGPLCARVHGVRCVDTPACTHHVTHHETRFQKPRRSWSNDDWQKIGIRLPACSSLTPTAHITHFFLFHSHGSTGTMTIGRILPGCSSLTPTGVTTRARACILYYSTTTILY